MATETAPEETVEAATPEDKKADTPKLTLFTLEKRVRGLEEARQNGVARPILAASESLDDDSWILEYEIDASVEPEASDERLKQIAQNAALYHRLKGLTLATRIAAVVEANWLVPRGDPRFGSWPRAILSAFWLDEQEGTKGEAEYLDLRWLPNTHSASGGVRLIKWAQLGNFVDVYIGKSPVLNREEMLMLPGIVRWLLHIRALYVERGRVYTNNGVRGMLTKH